MLGTGLTEGITEGAQNLVAQQAENVVTDESGFDYMEAANEAIAGATMGVLFAAPGIRPNSKKYTLNGQNISRTAARKLIEEGDIDGLIIENDPTLQEQLSNTNESNTTTTQESAGQESTLEDSSIASGVSEEQAADRSTEAGEAEVQEGEDAVSDNSGPLQLSEEQESQITEGARVTFVSSKDINQKKVSLGSVFEDGDQNQVDASRVQNILKERYKEFKKLNKCINVR